MMMMAMMPGTMNLRLSRSSLNQTRMRPSTGGLDPFPALAVQELDQRLFVVLAMKAVMIGAGVAGEVGVAAVDDDLQRRSGGRP